MIEFIEKDQYDFEVVKHEDSEPLGFGVLNLISIIFAVLVSPFLLIGILLTHKDTEENE